MSSHKYILEKHRGRSSRHSCPKCGKPQVFARYIDTQTGRYLHSSVGRCNREDSCGYHYTPKEYYCDNPQLSEFSDSIKNSKVTTRVKEKEPGRIPKQYIIQSLGYDSNFVAFLCSIFDRCSLESPTIERLMSDYYLGCTKDKSVIFWQLDGKKVRTGKIMQYDPTAGRRIKNASGAIDWVHAKLKKDKVLTEDFEMTQCLFGEHLLIRYPDKTVCLVESEKSALIGAGMMPEYLWLSTGGKQNLKADKCECLKGRNVIIIPDLGATEAWVKRGREIASEVGFSLVVSPMLEDVATNEDRANGLDIADYLIRELKAAPVPEMGIPITGITTSTATTPQLTAEEQTLQIMGLKNPSFYTLIDALDLVSHKTGKRLRTQIN